MKHTLKQILTGFFSRKTTLVIATGLIIGLSSFTHTPATPKTIEIDMVVKTIKDHVKFPNFSINGIQQEKVNVIFTVNETGQVNLVIANTGNVSLKRTIEEQFLKLTLKQLKANNAYSIQFNFKTI